ncbi:MAG TPA: hypothetical protein VFZ59_27995 [Verrucomicrobiae bacterium]|nr:hypothetical protein [Verrucomicrobiae bacterium]
MFVSAKNKVAALLVLLALILVPAPLLPPLALAGKVQAIFGIGWKSAYLMAAIGLQVVLYGSLGVVASFAVGAAKERRGRWMQLLVVPLVVVGIAIAVRSLKLGHVPMLANAAVPIVACVLGMLIGLGFRQHGWRVTLGSMLVLSSGMLWAYWPGVSSDLGRATEMQLRRIAEAASRLPNGEERFGVLLQTVFAPMPAASTRPSAVEHNRAAILALGIAVGHERLSRYVGLNRNSELVRMAVGVRSGTTLRGRDDWARHYCLSAALAVVENPFVSDAGGLIKEELDALTHGSGFSFGDLAADRAGVRFAEAATQSEKAADAMQVRLGNGYTVDDFFPKISDLPENLTLEQFRQDYGGVGSQRYRETFREIETRLDACAALALP